MNGSTRPALPGELCVCGRPAVVVHTLGGFGPTGDCGRQDGGAPVDGTCVFCGDTIDHHHYWTAERGFGRFAASPTNTPQGERCPLYRLRLADRIPDVNHDSIRPFVRAQDALERFEERLRAELVALFEQIGADFRATYRLDLPDEDGQSEEVDLEDVVFDLVWATKRVLSVDEHDVTTTGPDAGQAAVGVLVSMLRPRLDEFGVLPNPLAAFDDGRALLDMAGGDDAWLATLGVDRPLLIVRRVVRCHLDPQVPTDITRGWWS